MKKSNVDKKGNIGMMEDRKFKFRLMLPVLVLPFLTAFFWVLGGGSGSTGSKNSGNSKGLNTNLPSPHFDKKERVLDKLGFYQKADLDSARRAGRQRDDPYAAASPFSGSKSDFGRLTGLGNGELSKIQSKNGLKSYNSADSNEAKVEKSLRELRAVISPRVSTPGASDKGGEGGPSGIAAQAQLQSSNSDVDRLEKLMYAMQHMSDSSNKDPQVDRLNGMLDKVLKIQHPELVTQAENKTTAPAQNKSISPTLLNNEDRNLEMIGDKHANFGDTGKLSQPDDDEFFTFDDNNGPKAMTEMVVHAVIVSDQTLVSGATVKLRITEDAQVGGILLPKDNFVYGTAILNNERLLINIKSVMNGNVISPVNLEVYDLDGMAGIFIPGAIERDVSKESAAEGVNALGVTGFDASLSAQAATAGIQAAKTLFSRKVKLIRVFVKSGYQVLIKQSKTGA